MISDLHLGGRPADVPGKDGRTAPAFQFNHSYAALVEFIDWVAAQGRDAELVLNGDIVDFLAEDDYAVPVSPWTADEDAAADKLSAIAAHTRGADGRGVFEALGDLVRGGAGLTLLIGNHDVELALPGVRRRLLALLGAQQRHVHFIYDGEAYTRGRVLVEHGNRYDWWNRIDHDGLRRERSVRSRGLPVEDAERGHRYFQPPPGSHLVVEVMNRLKARYRFIDLLKPETGAVLPLVLALEPDLRPYLDALLRTGRRQLWSYLPGGPMFDNPGYMGAEAAARPGAGLDAVLDDVLPAQEAALFSEPGEAAVSDPGQMSVVSDFAAGVHAAAGIWLAGTIDRLVGASGSLAALARQDPARVPDRQRRRLHAALKAAHKQDRSFEPDTEDACYLDAARATIDGGAIDVVVYGHTHLAKRMRLDGGGREGWYLNTGTWCNVMRLPDAIDADYADAGQVLDDFLDALAVNDFEPYVRRHLTFAEIAIDDKSGQAASPALHAFGGKASPRLPWPGAQPS